MTFLFALLLAPLILLTACFAVEVCAGIRKLALKPAPSARPVKAAIIVPAHDEAAILANTLTRLAAAAGENMRLLLVADNCTDATAEIARNLGVEVIERSDAKLRGKGFALDYAKRHLESDPPQVVVIIDADCWTDADSLVQLVTHCAATDRPCQATNLQSPAADVPPPVQLSTFAFFVKNVIRQRGLQRLAGRAQLLGTGMAFPWSIFSSAELATGHIVEDLKLSQELAFAGHPPLLLEDATVWSRAETTANTLSQRSRWEGGFLQNAFGAAPALLAKGLARMNFGDIWSAISLMIPPFALLLAVDIAALIIVGPGIWLAGAEIWPLILLLSVVVLAVVAVAAAWCAGGSRFVSLNSLVRAPLYVLWKIPLYFGLVRRGAPKQWLRTQREEH